jgi:predicted amidohydrolase YtcJ
MRRLPRPAAEPAVAVSTHLRPDAPARGRRRRSAADLAILDAAIRTGDPANPHAEAIAFRDGRVLAVGDNAAVRATCDGDTELIGLAGAAVTPGLVDAHMHPFWAADFAQGADCSSCATLEQLRAALLAERALAGPGAVVRGWGVDYALFAATGLEGSLLRELAGGEALVTFFDCHTYLATPGVLARAGVDGPRSFRDNSQVVCRDGLPTGELREFGAYGIIADALPEQSRAERLARVAAVFERLNGVGLTGAHVMDGSPATFDALRDLEADGRLTLRLVVPLWIKPEMEREHTEHLATLVGERGELWRGGAAKFFVDGVVETGTAWLETPDTRGGCTRPFWPQPEEYTDAVARFAAAGFQCITHAIGDRAVRTALDAYAAAGAVAGVRHRVEHAEALADRELARLAAEGVVCSMQPLHMQWRQGDLTDEWTVRLGPERAARAYRVHDVLASGAVLALGSDWPVASFDPREGMAWARLRRTPGDLSAPVFDAEQRLGGEAALAGYTAGAAAAVSREHEEGRLAPGFRADITAFEADPARVGADDLPDLPVRLTVLGGTVVHRNP